MSEGLRDGPGRGPLEGKYWDPLPEPQAEKPFVPKTTPEQAAAKIDKRAKQLYDAHKEVIKPVEEANKRTLTSENEALRHRELRTGIPTDKPLGADDWGDYRGEIRQPETSNRRNAKEFARNNLDVLYNQAANEMESTTPKKLHNNDDEIARPDEKPEGTGEQRAA